MTSERIEKILLWTVKLGIFAVLLLPLYISGGMLFPFITGKNFFFRMLIEFAAVAWVGLAVLNKEFRPRLTPMVKAATTFLVILFLADLLGPNPYRSFFSNYERMEGFMMIFHLYLYFLMLVSVFKTRKDWMTFFHVTLVASIVVGLVGVFERMGLRVSMQGGFRIDSTIGNSSYLAAYLSFHVWILAVLLKAYWHRFGLRFLYAAALVFELMVIYFTATRGTTLALFLAALLLMVLVVVTWRRVLPDARLLYRKFAIGFLVVMFFIPVAFWQVRNTNLIPENSTLSRLASISLQDRTTQSRFSIWKMALVGVADRPVLGWGQENFYLVFQRYFDPKLYASEPWFDRSHNLFFDWMIHAGFLGLVGFLSILGIAFWSLWKGIRRGSIPVLEGLFIVMIFFTYLFQNLFVFDNLNTYLLYFGFLAFTNHLANPNVSSGSRSVLPHGYVPALGITLLLLVLVGGAGYYIHLKPILTSRALVQGLAAYQFKGPISVVESAFRKALSYESFGTTEVREQLASTARDILNTDRYSPDERTSFIKLAIEELRKEIDTPVRDVKHMIFLASILDRAGSIDTNYVAEAEFLLKQAILVSPQKQITYFELAQLYLAQNRVEEAMGLLQKTVDLEPNNQQAVVNLLMISKLSKNNELAERMKALVKLNHLNEDTLHRLAVVYQQTEDFSGAKDVYTRLVDVNKKNAQYRATAAALFAHFGEFDRALVEAEEASRLDPKFAEEAKTFIEQLKQIKP